MRGKKEDYFLLFLAGMLLLTWHLPAGEKKLTELSKGQLLYTLTTGESQYPMLLIFQNTDKETGQWQCKLPDTKDLLLCKAEECRILPFTEDLASSDLLIYSAFHLSCINSLASNAGLYEELLKWKGGKGGMEIRVYLEMIQDVLKKIKQSQIQVSKKGTQAVLEDKIKEDLEGAEGLTSFLESLMLENGDFYTAVCLYSRYRANVLKLIEPLQTKDSILDLFKTWDQSIVDAFNSLTVGQPKLENLFLSLCPKVPQDKYVLNIGTFSQLQHACYRAFQGFEQTRACSSFCDFPAWGDAMLTFLSVFPEDCETISPYQKAMEQAIKRYTKDKDQFGE